MSGMSQSDFIVLVVASGGLAALLILTATIVYLKVWRLEAEAEQLILADVSRKQRLLVPRDDQDNTNDLQDERSSHYVPPVPMTVESATAPTAYNQPRAAKATQQPPQQAAAHNNKKQVTAPPSQRDDPVDVVQQTNRTAYAPNNTTASTNHAVDNLDEETRRMWAELQEIEEQSAALEQARRRAAQSAYAARLAAHALGDEEALPVPTHYESAYREPAVQQIPQLKNRFQRGSSVTSSDYASGQSPAAQQLPSFHASQSSLDVDSGMAERATRVNPNTFFSQSDGAVTHTPVDYPTEEDDTWAIPLAPQPPTTTTTTTAASSRHPPPPMGAPPPPPPPPPPPAPVAALSPGQTRNDAAQTDVRVTATTVDVKEARKATNTSTATPMMSRKAHPTSQTPLRVRAPPTDMNNPIVRQDLERIAAHEAESEYEREQREKEEAAAAAARAKEERRAAERKKREDEERAAALAAERAAAGGARTDVMLESSSFVMRRLLRSNRLACPWRPSPSMFLHTRCHVLVWTIMAHDATYLSDCFTAYVSHRSHSSPHALQWTLLDFRRRSRRHVRPNWKLSERWKRNGD
eukprot:m.123551 g.123551  ORF g.123551 m.123551 type:complete len:580 (+) comp11130_c0_seq5:330-2069(+)